METNQGQEGEATDTILGRYSTAWYCPLLAEAIVVDDTLQRTFISDGWRWLYSSEHLNYLPR